MNVEDLICAEIMNGGVRVKATLSDDTKVNKEPWNKRLADKYIQLKELDNDEFQKWCGSMRKLCLRAW